ncbi:putative rRNA methylase YtqB [Lentibacillus populi]|uniref:rRNA methylase YtqB n=1 Tax=Lentibacillus populi TaxID=1827502 RepID=A0A9W5U1Q1_9BACI|nr:class I SAM-dependent methyltransferase [Lentibacillus populi]MBT2217039.1 methyltransferase domain-containing protein [Virgibacillus dakarensis]GGB61530.1 putative rRNA methylase YtqB [Lentibacillus populi]
MIKNIIAFSHQLLRESVQPGDIVIDATAGNGHDTVFLSNLVGENGHVLAFDIQAKAIEAVRMKLTEQHIENTRIIHDSHENVAVYLNEVDRIGGAIFNLGYLPGGDKSIITHGESTIIAVETILELLKNNGVIVLVIYHGHKGGVQEKEAVLQYVKQLDQQKFNALQYGFINQINNPPFIIAIEKK